MSTKILRLLAHSPSLRFQRTMQQNGSSVQTELRFARIHPDAKAPVYSSAHAAGMDLHSCEDAVVPARGRAMVDVGLKVEIPTGHYGRVAPRSGLAVKHGLDTGAGVIDEDYRGPVHVLLFNTSEQDYEVKKGDRIAQLIVERISRPHAHRVFSL
ncbi:Deoxyuridine 5'-triphosphate nucleotidohydrolase [Aphelenchoides fujianensis]|nr:Deoxyuridine 5'-triphosphate nucleotidohydrolase [Aphelenchoides fujianensis]